MTTDDPKILSVPQKEFFLKYMEKYVNYTYDALQATMTKTGTFRKVITMDGVIEQKALKLIPGPVLANFYSYQNKCSAFGVKFIPISDNKIGIERGDKIWGSLCFLENFVKWFPTDDAPEIMKKWIPKHAISRRLLNIFVLRTICIVILREHKRI